MGRYRDIDIVLLRTSCGTCSGISPRKTTQKTSPLYFLHDVWFCEHGNELSSRLDIFRAMKIQVDFSCDMTPCSVLVGYQRFEER